MAFNKIYYDDMINATSKAITLTQRDIFKSIKDNPLKAFEPLERKGKPLLSVDLAAEFNASLRFADFLKSKWGKIDTIGEETLAVEGEKLDFSDKDRLVVLMDMIDGTDLLERGLSNWCSAVVIYYPPEQKIMASAVCRPDDGYIYWARDDVEGAYKSKRKEVFKLSGPDVMKTTIDEASIAFYGQKPGRIFTLAKEEIFIENLGKMKKSKMRIYNLAGNPMMMRMVDGHKKINIIFELDGQAPHDVVPGAYIAMKAGASFYDLDKRKEINVNDLGVSLQRPAATDSRLRYVLSSNQKLSEEFLNLFN